MFSRIIPALRTPRHVGLFDYAVPESLEICPRDLVIVPFRNRTIVGVVREVSDSSKTTKALKFVIAPYAGLHLRPATLELLDRLARRSCSSPASVLHAWIGTPPKRPRVAAGTHLAPPTQTALLPEPELRLISERRTAPQGIISTVKRARSHGMRVLLITPWTDRARALADDLHAPVLTSSLAAGARFKQWSAFITGQTPVLVTTRIGAWLATEADTIVLDEPENDDHKQDELAPRYDARWIVEQACTSSTPVIEIGLTPRLGSPSDVTAPSIPLVQVALHPIDINVSDWSSVAGLQNRALLCIEDADAAKRPVTIIHPIHGERARLRCADCGWTAVCLRCGAGPTMDGGHLTCRRCGWIGDASASCPSCGGMRLSKSRPGRETLIRDLAHHGLSRVRVMSLGEWNAVAATTTPPPDEARRPLIVLTDLSLLAGGAEDLRRRERLIIAFRRLADDCKKFQADLVVQSDAALLTEAKSWLTPDGCAAAIERERHERLAFGLPPATRLIKLLVRGAPSDAARIATALSDTQTAIPDMKILGPYSVERLPGMRMPRSVIQLIAPKSTTDEAISRILEPVLTPDTLVDLDPIAFFE